MKPVFLLFTLLLVALSATAQTTPVTTDSIALSNAMLYYHAYGTGTPIVILSGGPGISAFQESDVAENLGKTYRTVLFEQRGTGRSWTRPLDKTTINLATAIDDLDQLRKRLGVDKLNLYGHSWGGMLASAYAAKHPDRVNSLLLVGAGEANVQRYFITEANMKLRRAPFADSLKYWSDSVNVQRDRQRAALERRRLGRMPYFYNTKKIDQYGLQVSKGVMNQKMGDLMWSDLFRSRFNLDSTLSAYKGPVLLVFGWQDAIGAATFYPYKQTLPQAEVQGINFCGHFPNLEQPENFFDIVNDFLGRHIPKPKTRP
ncbi:alpha/beta fold hydrolase [Spirosoma arcticum]